MCIRDRYQRRVRGGQIAIMGEYVRVFFRLRPSNSFDDKYAGSAVEACEEDGVVSLRARDPREGHTISKSVRFERAFLGHHTQEHVYDAVARPLIKDVLNGCAATVMALSLIHI
eukprot:TRINITY_DN45655_c0_g1_i1.p2 TRINITY_DN45655_c0_g1~~TRINITY_DN45655_c0_g1_i1.p2  ORF type:complete len:114 (+),score=28.21 TRINITY_DN45655_c0_g1_i1:48-389(+)